MRTEALKDLIRHLELYAHDENFKIDSYCSCSYDWREERYEYDRMTREEQKALYWYDGVYINNDFKIGFEIYAWKRHPHINILGLNRDELEEVEDVLNIHISFKGGE